MCCLLQAFQSFPHKNPVLTSQIHHISHRCKSCEHQEFIIKIVERKSHLLPERTYQLPGNRCPAQFFERIRTICLTRIYNHLRRRQFLLHFMMIRHNNRHTQFSGIGNLLHSGYSVITGDDRIHACIISSLYQLPVQSVAVLHSVRDICIHPRSGRTESSE